MARQIDFGKKLSNDDLLYLVERGQEHLAVEAFAAKGETVTIDQVRAMVEYPPDYGPAVAAGPDAVGRVLVNTDVRRETDVEPVGEDEDSVEVAEARLKSAQENLAQAQARATGGGAFDLTRSPDTRPIAQGENQAELMQQIAEDGTPNLQAEEEESKKASKSKTKEDTSS